MAKRTQKHKKRVKRRTRRRRLRRRRRSRVSRQRRRRRRQRKQQRGGSEASDELRKEMVAESSYQNKFTRRGMQGFLPPSAGQFATFAPNHCPNVIYRKAVYSQPGHTCWMWSAVLLLLNLSSPPILFPLNTLVKTYLVHLEYLLKTTLRDGNVCPLIPNWLKALMDWDFRTGAAAAAAKGETAWSLSGGHSASFLRSLLTASGYAVQGITKNSNSSSYKPVLRKTSEVGGPPILLLTMRRSELASETGDQRTPSARIHREQKILNVRRDKILKKEMSCLENKKVHERVPKEELRTPYCKAWAQAKAWEEDILWKWLFSDNAENVLGGIMNLMWKSEGTVSHHAVSFYRCREKGEVHIYICNTWGAPCTKNKITATEFIKQFVLLGEIDGLLIERLICLVAKRQSQFDSGRVTDKERRINALGERVRQELL